MCLLTVFLSFVCSCMSDSALPQILVGGPFPRSFIADAL